jgi:hypothetical protein
MLTNIAAVQMTPEAFIAAGSAGLGVRARPVVPSGLELVIETVMAVPYRGQAIQPSAEQAENACSSTRIRYNVRSPVESWRLSASDSRKVRICGPVLATFQTRSCRFAGNATVLGRAWGSDDQQAYHADVGALAVSARFRVRGDTPIITTDALAIPCKAATPARPRLAAAPWAKARAARVQPAPTC